MRGVQQVLTASLSCCFWAGLPCPRLAACGVTHHSRLPLAASRGSEQLCCLQVLVGWTAMSQPRQRIVLSFRGTASMQNLLSDFQVGDSRCLLKRRLKPTPSLPC